jgi:uracil-DNA glycosylase family 4
MEEMSNCEPFLRRELELIQPRVVVALGRIAFDSLLRIYSVRGLNWKFAHCAQFKIENGPWLVCSYHPSQQNTQTGKLTIEMFDQVWVIAKALLAR